MKIIPVFFLFVLLIFKGLQAQNISKIEPPEFSADYLKVREVLNNPDIPDSEKLQHLARVYPGISNPYERYVLSFLYFPNLYLEMGLNDSILPILQSGQREGLYYPLIYGERKWPSYVKEIEDRPGFDAFIAENERLKERDAENPVSEYFVVEPEAYDPNRKYPLLIVLHGGMGSHFQSYLSWHNSTLDSGFITAYFQGDVYRGSFGRRYTPESYENTLTMYRRVLSEYAVDTSMVFVGGPSAGGYRSVMLGLKGLIPASGLLLMFPVLPPDLSNEFFKKSSERRLRVVLVTGEHDFSIREQKEFAYRMDTAGIANRFIINPGIGHEYPDDFEKEISLSLDFLKMKPEGEEQLTR